MTHFCSLDQTAPDTSKDRSASESPKSPTPTADRCIFRPQGMGFRLSYKCIIGCRHCYQKAMPESEVFIDKDRLLGVIEEGREVGMKNVGFSGGEPFLCADTVFKGIELSRKLGYDGNVGVQTNGFWGKTPKSAKKIISKLAQAGFRPPEGRINLSVGEFHQEWIPFSTISNIVAAYWEEFQHPIFLNVTFSKGNKAIYNRLCEHFEKCGIPEDAYTSLIYPAVAHLGRADEVITEDADPVQPVSNFKECGAINKFTVEPTGYVAPCCGFNRFVKGICVGNIYNDTVQEIFDNTNKNIIYHYLKFKTQNEVHELLSKKFDLKTHYRHKCELCQDLFGKEEQVAYLEDIAETALAGLLNPGSRPGSTRFFHDEARATMPLVETETASSGAPEPEAPDLDQRLEALEAENARLRRAISDMTLKKQMLKEAAPVKSPSVSKPTLVSVRSVIK